MELISLREYIDKLDQLWSEGKLTPSQFRRKTVKYSNFLGRYLRLEMFVPCDENGVPIHDVLVTKEDYAKARSKVLFKDFSIPEKGRLVFHDSPTTDYEFTYSLEDDGTFTIDEGDYMICDVEGFQYRGLWLTETGIKEAA